MAGIYKKQCEKSIHPKFTPQPHQVEARDAFLASPYKGMLLYHKLGSGKTCTAIMIADAMIKARLINHVYILSPGSLRQGWIRELCEVCGDRPDIMKKHYTYITYNFGVAKNLPNFNDSLVIIDEIHLLVNSIRNNSLTAMAIRNAIMSSNCKFLALSGTPIYKDLSDWIILSKMLNPNILNKEQIVSEPASISDNDIQGIVSYFPGATEEFYPSVTHEEPIKVDMSKEQALNYTQVLKFEKQLMRPPDEMDKYIKNSDKALYIMAKKRLFSRKASNFFYPLKGKVGATAQLQEDTSCPLINTETQNKMCVSVSGKNESTVREAIGLGKIIIKYPTAIDEPEENPDFKFVSFDPEEFNALLVKRSRLVNDVVYQTIKISKGGDAPFFSVTASDLLYSSISKCQLFEIVPEKEDLFRLKKCGGELFPQPSIDVDDDGAEIITAKSNDYLVQDGGWMSCDTFSKKKLLTYSSKITALLLNVLHRPRQKHVIFTTFKISAGVILLKSFFNLMGIKSEIFSGDLDDKGRTTLLSTYNSPANRYGNNIQVLLITEAGATGITILEARHLHILESNTRAILLAQVIGRVVRFKSHFEMPKNEQHVSIWRYWAYANHPKDDEDDILDSSSIDEFLYNAGEESLEKIREFEERLQKASITGKGTVFKKVVNLEQSNKIEIPRFSTFSGSLKFPLKENQIFVYLSNTNGNINIPNSKVWPTLENLGATLEITNGLSGKTYALPTHNGKILLTDAKITKAVKKLYKTALEKKNMQFMIALDNREIAGSFLQAGEIPDNIVFSERYAETLKHEAMQV